MKKAKPLQFTPGTTIPIGDSCGGREKMPQIVLPDGSAICLYSFDPGCGPRQHARRKKNLPTLDTRNAFGARAVELVNLLDERTVATILAALRYYQNDMDNGQCLSMDVDPDREINDIATNNGKLVQLSDESINELCDKLNQ